MNGKEPNICADVDIKKFIMVGQRCYEVPQDVADDLASTRAHRTALLEALQELLSFHKAWTAADLTEHNWNKLPCVNKARAAIKQANM